MKYLEQQDKAVADAIGQELVRQRDTIELIASSRGLGPKEMKEVAHLIGLAFKNPNRSTVKDQILGSVREITSRYPLYGGI
jgi:glycine/serine hydroxymethyltransferase